VAGSRTRAALEREKALALRAIKELEFDRAMGKVSEKDFTEMSGRLRARAARIIRQLDASGSYRAKIEQEIEKRIGRVANACPSCAAANDLDARFCKKCGTALGAQS
jgi:ribosomal protein L40E